jgi:recombination protein RecR
MYFVLGGTISLTEREPEKFVRIRELLERTKTVTPSEIIMAFAANSEGDNTIDYLRSLLADSGMKLSTLGRGLSTGSELEYADTDTIRNALEGRK